jgi:diaminohydroxyphosphoribosylaminopyrimidine deaminase/5-amino-6-(5-phosphoribosylamino)uracil reductase
MSAEHLKYMQRCLQLAANGFGFTRSNPLVGCVIVFQGKIISEGFHRGFGLPHAEVEALSKIKDNTILANAIVYVNLEPCSHFGKTPPCADLLISKGVKHVVIASLDPNPLVSGAGIKKMQAAGINVVPGILDKENKELNKRFFTFHTKSRPYIILKWAQSKDGFLAPLNHKGSFKLTNSLSNSLVHQWRAQEMGILVGRNTVENDNPELTVRNIDGQNPVRIVLDPSNKLGNNFAVFNNNATTLIYNNKITQIVANVERIKIDQDNFLANVLKDLHDRNILSVLVEGGAFTLDSFIQSNLWDEARIFKTSVELKTGIPSPIIHGLKTGSIFVDTDELVNLIQP